MRGREVKRFRNHCYNHYYLNIISNRWLTITSARNPNGLNNGTHYVSKESNKILYLVTMINLRPSFVCLLLFFFVVTSLLNLPLLPVPLRDTTSFTSFLYLFTPNSKLYEIENWPTRGIWETQSRGSRDVVPVVIET